MPPKPSPPPKVFGIGLSRTGTESLTEALRILGWRKSVHWPLSLSEIADAEAATDVTVACRFPALARVHPKAKFILTIRDAEAWTRSIHRFFTKEHYGWVRDHCNEDQFQFAMDAERKLYGREVYTGEYGAHGLMYPCTLDDSVLKKAYRFHLENVLKFFRKQPGRLMLFSLCGGEGWGPLCRFLEVPVPRGDFPWRNRNP